MRILVTGSRDWSNRDAIEGALYQQWMRAGGSGRATLVHGACSTGADAIAAEVWASHTPKSAIEAHPADWSRGRRAGPERNAAMVALGADVCLAFIGDCTSPRCHLDRSHPSHGATGCADLAEAAGIRTIRYYARDETANPESEEDA